MKAKNWLVLVLLLVFAVLAVEGGSSFFSNHAYYLTMLKEGVNRGLVCSALILGALPLGYLYLVEKPKIWGMIATTGLGLGSFALLHGMIKGYLLDGGAAISLLFNVLLFFVFAIGIFWGIWTLGHFLSRKMRILSETNRTNLLLIFGLGLVTLLVLMQVLMGFGIFYSPIVRAILLLLLGFSYFENKKQKQIGLFLEENLQGWKEFLGSKYAVLFGVLVVLSFAYFFFGFMHSYIPYPTARDANHEYMYIPKVIMENAGVLWGNQGAASGMPYLWHSFIAFAFSLRRPLVSLTGIASDTFAVNMNFWSGILVLIYGLVTFQQAQKLLSSSQGSLSLRQPSFFFAWGLLLLWLTSGMGAFLLFVDNKTDMGVLLIAMMGLLAGLSAMKNFQEQKGHSSSLILLVLSALFFAFAVMAKPTAFIDVVLFGLLMLGLWLNAGVALGGGLVVLGLMGILQPLNAIAFMSPSFGKIIIAVGILILLISAFFAIREKKKEKSDFKTAFLFPLQQILVWGGVFLAAILLFKLPWTAYANYKSGKEVTLPQLLQSTLLGQNASAEVQNKSENKAQSSQLFLAQEADFAELQSQNHSDERLENQRTAQLSLAQCKAENFTKTDLEKNKQKAPGGALLEDFGRYVGFGAKKFEKSGFAGLLLKGLFWKNNTCYGFNADAVLLCEHKKSLQSGDYQVLAQLIPQLKNPEGPVAKLIKAIPESGEDLVKLQDAHKALMTYVQEHSIETTEDAFYVPYRYLVPFNAIFNRSLQNHSSYYTDIGLIWIFVLVALVGALITALFQKRKNLILITLITLIGWAIWWTIAAGILRYGLGLVIWSIIVLMIWGEELLSQDRADELAQALYPVFLLSFGFLMLVQMGLNFIRIASQASDGAFGRYKAGVGSGRVITANLVSHEQLDREFTAQDIFKLQFGQYLPFIDAVKERKDEDGVRIAGTYLPYFLHNQRNVKMDNLLTSLWEEMSDYNSCKSYHRIKNQHIKYLVIDPNIGTVGRVGQGNESLFHRFFAKLNKEETQILTPGTITMLVNLYQDGYLKLNYTNNLGAKYAFSLSDAELQSEFGSLTAEELILLRGKLAVAKFFISQQDFSLLDHIFSLFQKRLASPVGIEDLANLMNLQIDSVKIQTFIQQQDPKLLASFTDDERQLMSVYLPLIQGKVDPQRLVGLLQQSMLGSSQIIVLELE